jgi:hypothetical protein
MDRDTQDERKRVLAAAEVHAVSPEVAARLHRFASSRARSEPVRVEGRSLLHEAAEEVADMANYLTWEAQRHSDVPGWEQVIDRALGDVVLCWATLLQAQSLAEDLRVPNAEVRDEAVGHP